MIVPVKSFTRGSNMEISPLIYPIDQPYLMNGCNNAYKVGQITKDLGYSIVDTTMVASKSVLGLFNFRQVPGTEKMLATMNNAGDTATALYYKIAAGAWTEIAAGAAAWTSANQMIEMESFIGYCFFVGYNGSSFLPVASLTGTTFSTVTNVTGMPQGKFVKKFDGQLFVANCYTGGQAYPFRVYNSSYPITGVITWDSGVDPSAGFLDVDYSEEIMGMETMWGNLIAFTEYTTYFYNLSSWTPQWAQGCSSHRTIKKHKAYLLWCDFDGVQLSTGGQPQCISGEVASLYKASNKRALFSEIVNEQYWTYLGNITVGDTSYTNLAIIFDIGKSIWWLREFAEPLTSFAKFNNAGELRLYMGTASGKVMNKGLYTDATLLKSDNGSDILSEFILPPFHLDSLDKFHKLNRVIAYANKPGGIILYARILDQEGNTTTEYQPIGTLTQYINSFDVDVDPGVMLQIKGTESGQKEFWSFLGYALDVLVDSNIPKP